MENFIRNKHERVDNLHVENYKIIQNKKYFCYGMDAVLLSYYVNTLMNIHKNNKIMDLGTGTGIIPILLYYINSSWVIHGIEIQEYFADMARRSIKLNNINNNVNIYHCDLRDIPKEVVKNTYDVVVSNPPYMSSNTLKNENEYKAIARHEITCSLIDVVQAAKKLLVNRGKLFMIYKSDRLVDVISCMRDNNIEPKTLCFIYPKMSKEPNLIMVEGVKNGNPQLKFHPPIIIYNEDGGYTDQLKSIYGYE